MILGGQQTRLHRRPPGGTWAPSLTGAPPGRQPAFLGLCHALGSVCLTAVSLAEMVIFMCSFDFGVCLWCMLHESKASVCPPVFLSPCYGNMTAPQGDSWMSQCWKTLLGFKIYLSLRFFKPLNVEIGWDGSLDKTLVNFVSSKEALGNSKETLFILCRNSVLLLPFVLGLGTLSQSQ